MGAWLPFLTLGLAATIGSVVGAVMLGGWYALGLGLLAAFVAFITGAQLVLAAAVSATRPPPPCPGCQAEDSPFSPYDRTTGLLQHSLELWVAQEPLQFMGLPFGARMALVRMGDDLFVYSPIGLSDSLREAVEELGTVRWILAPNMLHHLYVAEWTEAFPEAEVWAAPKLAERRPDIAWTGTLSEPEQATWDRGELDVAVAHGHAMHVEVALFHQTSKTLLLCDLLENLGHAPETSLALRTMLGLGGMAGRPTPPTDWKWTIEDPAVMRAAIDRVLAWPFDRIVLAHGRLVDQVAKEALRRAFAFL